MKKILDITSFEKALITLGEALEEHKKARTNALIRDACIQRFEYSYELSHKMLKRHLEATSANAAEIDKKWLEEVRNMKELDPLRKYARYGEGKQWIYNQRRIYGEEVRFTDPIRHPEPYEVLHEMDSLYIDPGIYYYVLVIMGVEFVINCGASELDLFNDWLEKNNQISPIRRGSEKMIQRGP